MSYLERRAVLTKHPSITTFIVNILWSTLSAHQLIHPMHFVSHSQVTLYAVLSVVHLLLWRALILFSPTYFPFYFPLYRFSWGRGDDGGRILQHVPCEELLKDRFHMTTNILRTKNRHLVEKCSFHSPWKPKTFIMKWLTIYFRNEYTNV